MNFLNGMSAVLNERNQFTTTENGAVAHSSTGSAVLDLFSLGGAYRTRTEGDIVKLVDKALAENATLTMKTLFYLRDVLEGQGERRFFRVATNYIAKKYPNTMKENVKHIAAFGRWDDVYSLFDTTLEGTAVEAIKLQLMEDMKAEYPSLCAKWLKSENASSSDTKKLGRRTAKLLGLNNKDYRKMLSVLRKKINLLERLITEGKWDEIDYSRIPSRAGKMYAKAFLRNDEDRYRNFLDKLTKGEVKVNSKALYPHELVGKMLSYRVSETDKKLFDGMWKNLPDFTNGNFENSMCVVDVSGSMSGTPMEVAIGLGMYIAERNKGPFQDHFITFSSNPSLQKIVGRDLYEKVQNISKADWSMTTNLEAVFDLILEVYDRGVSEDEIVHKLYLISDMQFDSAITTVKTTSNSRYGSRKEAVTEAYMDTMRRKFSDKGYEMPEIVFWNVDARHDQSPVKMDERGFQTVSGFSPSILQHVMTGVGQTAYEMMMEVLESERYACIV